MNITRLHRTIGVRIGHVQVGGGAPVVVQSMTSTDTADVERTTDQVAALAAAGSEIVRVTVNVPEAAAAVPEIRQRLLDRGCAVPLVHVAEVMRPLPVQTVAGAPASSAPGVRATATASPDALPEPVPSPAPPAAAPRAGAAPSGRPPPTAKAPIPASPARTPKPAAPAKTPVISYDERN